MAVTTTSYASGLGAGNYVRGAGVSLTTVTWTSDAAGAATQTITGFDGQIHRIVTDPAAGGSAPTDDYDITLVDSDGLDILGGAGANRDTANTEQLDISAVAPLVHYGDLVLTVAAAGDTKAGTVKIYWR